MYMSMIRTVEATIAMYTLKSEFNSTDCSIMEK